MTEHSVEEVRARAAIYAEINVPETHGMLTAYADLREQIELARNGVTDEVVEVAVRAFRKSYATDGASSLAKITSNAMRSTLLAVAHLLPSGERGGVDFSGTSFVCYLIDNHEREMVAEESLHGWIADFLKKPRYCTHPPAQAAQAVQATKRPDDVSVDGLRAKCAAIAANRDYWFGEAERLRMALYEATHQAVPAPTAEPVVHGEAVFTGLNVDGTPRYERLAAQPRAVPDGWRETFDELLEDYAGARAETGIWNVTQSVQPEGGIRMPKPRLAKLRAHVDLLAAATSQGESS